MRLRLWLLAAAVLLVVGVVLGTGTAVAVENVGAWEKGWGCPPEMRGELDLSWWPTEATPQPVKDDLRKGYWWWPTEPGAEKDKVWGNRGVVYNLWAKEEPKPAPPPAPPAPPVQRPRPPAPPAPPPAPVTEPKVRREFTLPGIFFYFDSTKMKPGTEERLREVIDYANQYPTDYVIVEGHTCDLGTDAYNMALGMRRARAAAEAIKARGIKNERIIVESYGESKPAVPNDSTANREKNRRVVFKVAEEVPAAMKEKAGK